MLNYFNVIKIVLFLGIMTYSLSSFSLTPKRKLRANIGFRSFYVDDLQVEARVFGFQGGIEFEQPLTKTLSTTISIGAIIETGSNNSLRNDEFAPDRQWTLQKGTIEWKPFSFLEIQGGAINQGIHNSPLLVGGVAFFGASQILRVNLTKEHSIYIRAQQSIPNNQNLADRIGSVDEGTPAFFIQTAGLDLKGDLLSLKIEGSQYTFNELSNSVAFESQELGNSVGPNAPTTARFVYQFQGLNLSFDGSFHFNESSRINFKGQFLNNQDAPEQRNTGYLFHGGIEINSITYFAEYFHNESDTSPAFYNSKIYGHNNKEGIGFGISGKIEKANVEFSLRYNDLSVIQENSLFQSDTKLVAFRLRKNLEF